MSFTDVNKIVMVGGTSQIPFIKTYWQNKINPEKQELIYHDPFSSVAFGAALYAGRVSKSSGVKMPLELNTVSSYNIALQKPSHSNDNDILIFKNSPLPISAKRIYRIGPNEILKFALVQYWDENEIFKLGTIKIGPFQNIENWTVELFVENRSNGTIAVKVKSATNGKDLKFSFEKEESKYEYNAEDQRKLLNSITINNIF
jgi:molecular chaperone DnaK (HSP70)